MRITAFCASLLSGLFALSSAGAQEPAPVVVDDCSTLSAKWSFYDGSEYPGATGSLEKAPSGIAFSYDFSKGGAYVSALREVPYSGKHQEFKLSVSSPEDCIAFFRVVDSKGRTFQSSQLKVAKGDSTLSVKTDSKWAEAWGGSAETASPDLPIETLAFSISKEEGFPKKGVVYIKGLSSIGGAGGAAWKFKGEGVSFSSLGWDLKGSWAGPDDALFLKIDAKPLKDASDASVSISLPMAGRAQAKFFDLKAGEPQELVFNPRLSGGGNPGNVYSLKISLKSKGGEFSTVARLAGEKSAEVNLGAPRSSTQIKELPFGTCVHFCYALSGAFKGWSDYKRITDMIAASGLKWIRDGVHVVKGADGKPHLRPYDLEWIKYAKSKGVETIVVIENFSADKPLDELVAESVAIASETEGVVKVFELGNEPNNFGNWRKKYSSVPGKEAMWNGNEPDGSTSQWVKEHLKYTNAVADAMKKARPDSILIGLGAAAPTNMRYFDIGVTKSLDGVVEHPYSMCMPPEKVPYGWSMEKRDGVKIGDKDNNFHAIVDSYMEKFKQSGQPRSLWVTEFGFTTLRFDGKNESGLHAGFSEEAQAAYLVRRFIHSLALPIAVSCQYDFIDDYGSNPSMDEANFGIVRSDFSPKPAFYAIQRMNSIFDGFKLDSAATVSIDKSPVHRGMLRSELVRDWDGASIGSLNSVLAFPFANKELLDGRLLALWSAQPYSREFNNRAVSVSIKGWDNIAPSPAIGINLVSGETFDVPFNVVDGAVKLEALSLGNDPVVVKFLKAAK